MTSRFARLCLAAGLLAVLPGLQAQMTQPPAHGRAPAAIPVNSGDEIVDTFKLPSGDIDGVLGALEIYTGRTVIRPATLPVAPGGYSLVLVHVPKSEVVLALETLLSINQIGVVPLGDRFLKVVPLSVTRAEAPEFISGSAFDLPASGKIATKLFQLQFLRVSELFSQGLNTLLTPGIGGGVVVLEKANAALVTDTVSNLQRVELLVGSLDKPSTSGLTPKFYAIHYAKASDLVNKIKAILSGAVQNQIGTATTYNADDRTNQVVVMCDPRQLPIFDDLIGRLDVKSDPNTRTEVIYLKHADARDMTSLLSALVTGQTAAAQKSSSSPSVRPGEIATPTPAPSPLQSAMQSLSIGTNEFSTLMTIEADERSNSVVVSGTVDDIRLLRELIDKLDVALAQVRIQVIIAEVTLSDTDISGITALGLTAGQNSNGATQITNFTGSIAGWDLSNGVVNPLAFNAAFNSTSTGQKNVVHVIQAPVIITAHNKAAEVTVGQQVPIINGGQSTLSTSVTPVNSFTSTYQNVAIDLSVTPLIGDNGDIQLTIDQKVDDLGANVTIQAGDVQPVINHREVKSFLTVKDGQMIVLGGLQQTQKSASQAKVGFLYEIPIISQLLGGHTDEYDRTELLFFIRPHIITPEQGTADTERRIKELSNRGEVEQFLKNPGAVNNSKSQNLLDRFKSD